MKPDLDQLPKARLDFIKPMLAKKIRWLRPKLVADIDLDY